MKRLFGRARAGSPAASSSSTPPGGRYQEPAGRRSESFEAVQSYSPVLLPQTSSDTYGYETYAPTQLAAKDVYSAAPASWAAREATLSQPSPRMSPSDSLEGQSFQQMEVLQHANGHGHSTGSQRTSYIGGFGTAADSHILHADQTQAHQRTSSYPLAQEVNFRPGSLVQLPSGPNGSPSALGLMSPMTAGYEQAQPQPQPPSLSSEPKLPARLYRSQHQPSASLSYASAGSGSVGPGAGAPLQPASGAPQRRASSRRAPPAVPPALQNEHDLLVAQQRERESAREREASSGSDSGANHMHISALAHKDSLGALLDQARALQQQQAQWGHPSADSTHDGVSYIFGDDEPSERLSADISVRGGRGLMRRLSSGAGWGSPGSRSAQRSSVDGVHLQATQTDHGAAGRSPHLLAARQPSSAGASPLMQPLERRASDASSSGGGGLFSRFRSNKGKEREAFDKSPQLREALQRMTDDGASDRDHASFQRQQESAPGASLARHPSLSGGRRDVPQQVQRRDSAAHPAASAAGPMVRPSSMYDRSPLPRDPQLQPTHRSSPSQLPENLLTGPSHGGGLTRKLSQDRKPPDASAPAQQSNSARKWLGGSGREEKDIAKTADKTQRKDDGIVEITEKVGWLCANEGSPLEWAYMLSLAGTLSRSESASKEAAQALRKEFKYAKPEAQRRAARVWAILALRSSDRFRLQIATKKFLEVVEDIIRSKKTPPDAREGVLNALSVLAYEFKKDKDLSYITKVYNKHRPPDKPINGEGLDIQYKLFTPPPGAALRVVKRSERRQREQEEARQREQERAPQDVTTGRLQEDCEAAIRTATQLIEALSASSPGEGAPIAEYLDTLHRTQTYLLAHVPSARSAAERARIIALEAHARRLASEADRDFGERPPTDEEVLISDLLEANEHINRALMLARTRNLVLASEDGRSGVSNGRGPGAAMLPIQHSSQIATQDSLRADPATWSENEEQEALSDSDRAFRPLSADESAFRPATPQLSQNGHERTGSQNFSLPSGLLSHPNRSATWGDYETGADAPKPHPQPQSAAAAATLAADHVSHQPFIQSMSADRHVPFEHAEIPSPLLNQLGIKRHEQRSAPGAPVLGSTTSTQPTYRGGPRPFLGNASRLAAPAPPLPQHDSSKADMQAAAPDSTSSFMASPHAQSSAINGRAEEPTREPSPIPPTSHPQLAPILTQIGHADAARASPAPSTDSSIIETPVFPSEKALGKRRAVSIRENSLDERAATPERAWPPVPPPLPMAPIDALHAQASIMHDTPSNTDERMNFLRSRPMPPMPPITADASISNHTVH